MRLVSLRSTIARPAFAWLALGLLLGTVLGTAASQLRPTDRLVVGGTGRTLSVLLVTDRTEVLIGGGTDPNDAADFVDRSTVPWQRPLELLVVPAWDPEHIPGALGIIERGNAHAIVVWGQAGNEPAWTVLERRAQTAGISFEWIRGAAVIPIDATTRLLLETRPNGGVICLERGELRVVIVDTGGEQPSRACRQSAATISLRRTITPEARLLVRPRPLRASELASAAPYEVQLERGERLTIRLRDAELRLPLDALLTDPRRVLSPHSSSSREPAR
ncbi:hypothetical protein [Thermomicrobium sp.]